MPRILIVLLTIATTLSVSAAPPEAGRPLTREREAMESLYSLVATLPVLDRKVLFHGLTAEAKAALWNIQFERFSADHQLSPEQKALMAEAAVLFSPALYSVDHQSADWDRLVRTPLRGFDEKALALFPRDVVVEVFGELGPPDLAGLAAIPPGQEKLSQSLNRGLKPVPLLPSSCSCSTESDWCWGFSSCGISGTTCYTDNNGGCGTGWQYNCNSRCGYGPHS